METRWLYVTSEELERLRDKTGGVCVIPYGAVEKHGLHMPLGTDILQAEYYAYEASRIEPVCVFPGIPFGDMSCGHPSTPCGTISIPMSTSFLLLEQLCDQIGRYGFHKILILNAHGGNCAWQTAFLQQLGNKKKDYVVAIVKTFMVETYRELLDTVTNSPSGTVPELTPEDEVTLKRYYDDKIPTGHACLIEASRVMDIAPGTVKPDRLGIESGKSRHKTDKFAAAGIEIRDDGWFVDFPHNYATERDPVDATETIGRALNRLAVSRIANAFKVFKEDEDLLRWHKEKLREWL